MWLLDPLSPMKGIPPHYTPVGCCMPVKSPQEPSAVLLYRWGLRAVPWSLRRRLVLSAIPNNKISRCFRFVFEPHEKRKINAGLLPACLPLREHRPALRVIICAGGVIVFWRFIFVFLGAEQAILCRLFYIISRKRSGCNKLHIQHQSQPNYGYNNTTQHSKEEGVRCINILVRHICVFVIVCVYFILFYFFFRWRQPR